MTIPLHFFIAEPETLLPRWQQAFPLSIALSSSQLVDIAVMPDIAWLRLKEDVPVKQQIENIYVRLGPSVKIVALSDIPNDREALNAFAMSAKGYANTHTSPELLKKIADVVLQGGVWIGESLMQRIKGKIRIE